jgi:hypothetical protein
VWYLYRFIPRDEEGPPVQDQAHREEDKKKSGMKKKGGFAAKNEPVAEMARAQGHTVAAHDEGELVVYGFPPWEKLTEAEKRRVQLAKDCRAFRGMPDSDWTFAECMAFQELSRTAPDFVVTDTMLLVYALHLR